MSVSAGFYKVTRMIQSHEGSLDPGPTPWLITISPVTDPALSYTFRVAGAIDQELATHNKNEMIAIVESDDAQQLVIRGKDLKRDAVLNGRFGPPPQTDSNQRFVDVLAPIMPKGFT